MRYFQRIFHPYLKVVTPCLIHLKTIRLALRVVTCCWAVLLLQQAALPWRQVLPHKA